MALDSERFSIREYTSKMRSSDVLKCWPFDETKRKNIEAFLPPIEVRKFKWWADEIENKEAKMSVAVNERVDMCLAESSRTMEQIKMKVKSRVPKKRSIVEIFAVAPQVENVYEDEDEDCGDVISSEDDEFHDVKLSALIYGGVSDKMKRKMKLKDGTIAIVDKLKKLDKNKKNGKKKERESALTDLSIPDHKEKPLKLKQKYPLGLIANFSGSSHNVELAKDLSDAIPVQSKKLKQKCLMAVKKAKTFGTSKQNKSILSVCGILKNHSKVVSGKKSIIGTLRKSSEANWSSIDQSDRRVRFSGKDDVLGERRKSVLPVEFPKLQKSNCSSSDVSIEMDHSADRGKRFVAVEVNGSDRRSSISKENENEVQFFTEKHSSDMCLCVDKPNFLRPHISQEHLPDKHVTLNQASYSSENLHCLGHNYRGAAPYRLSTCPPGFLSMEKEAYMHSMMPQGGENMSVASHFAKGNENQKLLFPSETASENHDGQNPQYYPFGFHHLSPKELMRSICSLPDSEQRGVMCLGSSTNTDFFGLPLNSRREFIELNSRGKGGFDQLLLRPSNPGDHLCFKNYDERPPQANHFQFSPLQDGRKEKPIFLVSSRPGITQQETGRCEGPFLDYLRGSSQSVYPLDSGLDLMNIPSHRNKQYDHIWNRSGDRNTSPDLIQPTLRLMGQEFSVGKNYINLHDEEKVWMDKQIITEHRPHFEPDLIIQPASGKGKKIASLSEIQINQASQSVLQMRPSESRLSHPYTNAVYENACHVFSDPIMRSHPYYPLDASPALFNKESIFQEPFVCAYEPPPVKPRPLQASSPQNAVQNLSLNYPNSNTKQKQPYASSSAFRFPFLRPDFGDHVRPSCCQSSCKSLPPVSLNATQVKESMTGSLQSYYDAGGSQHPCTMSRNSFQKFPPVLCRPDAPYMYNPLSIQSPLQNEPGLVATNHRFSPILTMNKGREYRMKLKERTKARFCVQESAFGKITKKRPADKSDYSEKPTKLPNLEISGDPSCGLTTLKAIGLDLAKDIANSRESENATQLDYKGTARIDPFKRDGPVKLTAGVKHIFKPSESMYQSNSRLTHSKIPFAAVTMSGVAAESKMKSAEIYRF